MSALMILIAQGQSDFTPESPIRGVIRWDLDSSLRELRLRLIWHTTGKGSTDISIVEERDFSGSQTKGEQSFEFVLPDAPYSFSGKLISLHWALELVSQPGNFSSKTEFTLSPSGKEIVLPDIPQKTFR